MSQKRAKKVKKRNKKTAQKRPAPRVANTTSLNTFSQDSPILSEGRRFSSINSEYNSVYDYSENLQESCGLSENDLLFLDEDGPVEVLSMLNDFVKKGTLAETEYERFKSMYVNFFAVWCLSVISDRPEDPAPYMDWWFDDNQLVSLTMDDGLTKLSIPEELKDMPDEAITIWVAGKILNEQSFHEEVDDFVFSNDLYFDKYHGNPWQEEANKMRVFIGLNP